MAGRLLKDMATYLPAKLLPALTGVISAPILTRLFPPGEYADYALALGISDLLFALGCSGFASGVVRFFAAYRARSAVGSFFYNLFGAVLAVVSTLGLLTAGLLLTIGEKAAGSLRPLLFLSIVVFLLQSVWTILMQILRGQERSGLYTSFELFTRYGGLGFGLLLVLVFGLRVEGLVWGEIIAPALVIPILFAVTTRSMRAGPRAFHLGGAVEMWQFAWPLAVGNMAMWGLRLSARYTIGFFRSEAEVGLYSVSFSLSQKSIDMIVALVLFAMGPMLMHAWEREGRQHTEELLTMTTRVFIILCLPLCAGLTVLARPFVGLLADEAYLEGYRIVGYIAFSSLVWGLSQIASMGTIIKQRTRKIMINQGIAAAIHIALSLLLVPRFGFVAAGAATLIGYVVLCFLQAQQSRPFLTWRVPWPTVRNSLVATIAMSAVAAGGYYLAGDRSVGIHVGYLLLSITAAILTYFGVLLALGEANVEERAVIRELWSRIQRRMAYIRGSRCA